MTFHCLGQFLPSIDCTFLIGFPSTDRSSTLAVPFDDISLSDCKRWKITVLGLLSIWHRSGWIPGFRYHSLGLLVVGVMRSLNPTTRNGNMLLLPFPNCFPSRNWPRSVILSVHLDRAVHQYCIARIPATLNVRSIDHYIELCCHNLHPHFPSRSSLVVLSNVVVLGGSSWL